MPEKASFDAVGEAVLFSCRRINLTKPLLGWQANRIIAASLPPSQTTLFSYFFNFGRSEEKAAQSILQINFSLII